MLNQTTATGTGYASSAPQIAPPRLTGVPSALAGLEAQLADLGSILHNIENRLDAAGVLRPTSPQAVQSGSVPAPPNYQSSLANGIDGQRLRIARICESLTELHERIDL